MAWLLLRDDDLFRLTLNRHHNIDKYNTKHSRWKNTVFSNRERSENAHSGVNMNYCRQYVRVLKGKTSSDKKANVGRWSGKFAKFILFVMSRCPFSLMANFIDCKELKFKSEGCSFYVWSYFHAVIKTDWIHTSEVFANFHLIFFAGEYGFVLYIIFFFQKSCGLYIQLRHFFSFNHDTFWLIFFSTVTMRNDRLDVPI